MRDEMAPGDPVLFYHSSCPEPGIAGFARVASKPYPDDTQFEVGGKYFDPKSKRENPRWVHVDVQFVKKVRLIPLADLRTHPALADMRILQKGNRLSITPVSPAEWAAIESLL